MIQDIPWLLLEKYFAKETTEVENCQIQEWIENVSENQLIFNQLKHYFEEAGSLPLEFVPDAKVALVKVNDKLSFTPKKAFKRSYVWYAMAASVLVLVAFLWLTRNTTPTQSQPFLSLSAADATTNSIVLSDGTHVWLNAGSKLEYPHKFGQTREVNLIGEGYFEVAHDPAHPFLVKTAQNTVKVLGTKFDMRAYHKESKTSLFVTEGKVSFGNQKGDQILLTMGQRSSYSLANQTFDEITALDPNCLAWKTKEFIFDNKPLSLVFQTLSEVYHFNYKFNNKALESRRITSQFKELPISDIISIIAVATKTEITLKTNPKLEVIINPDTRQ